MRSRTFHGLAIALVVLVPFLQVHTVHAAGTLYVDPPSTIILNPGDTFAVTLSITNVDPFNGWDIMLETNSSVIAAIAIATTGNVLGSITEFVNCLDGIGTNCQPNFGDGPGIVHSAAASYGTPQAHSSGYLFTVTYKVLNSKSDYSEINFQKALISDGTTIPVPVTTMNGTYGSQVPQPDFTISASNSVVNVTQGNSANVLISLTGLNGIEDYVTLDSSSSISGVDLSLNPSSVIVTDGQSSTSMLTVNTTMSTPATLYTITVTGTPTSSRSHSVRVDVNVQRPGYFILDARPSLLVLHAHDSGTSNIIVASEQGFSGTIQLSVATRVPGLAVSLGSSALTLAPGTNATTTLTVETPPSNITFTYMITLNATQGGVLRSLQMWVSPPSSDIGFTLSASTLSLKAGASSTLSLTIASKDYFKGIVYMLAASPSGTRLSFAPSRVYFSYTNSTLQGQSTLTVSIDPAAPPGNNYIILTAIGGSISRSTNMTLTVQPASTTPSTSNLAIPKTILGLQPPVYFGVLAALGIVLAIAALRELRKPKKRRVLLDDS